MNPHMHPPQDERAFSEWEKARKTARKLMFKEVALWMVPVAFIVGCLIMGLGEDKGEAKMGAFLDTSWLFAVKTFLVILQLLIFEWMIKRVVSTKWFDRHGAFIEFGKARDRMGTPQEQQGDATACAIAVAAWTLFRAVFILAFFQFHAGAG